MTEPAFASGVYAAAAFALDGGGTLAEVEVAYVTAGTLDAEGGNAILLTHGYTSSHTFIQPGSAAAEGSWSELVGPGRAIDTNRFFVISSNALGSCYGSTGPASADPATGIAYGPEFPAIAFADIVRLQADLLASLGIRRLHAVVGVSMGGFQVLQWGVQYPGRASRLVVALSSLDGSFIRPAGTDTLGEALRAEPAWNGGRPAPGAMVPFLTTLRLATLERYGMNEYLEAQGLEDAARGQRMREMAVQWARGFDANSLVVLRDAMARFNVTEAAGAIRAKLLLVLSTTDAMFPAAKGPAVTESLRASGVDAGFLELQSNYGHLASGLDWQKWAQPLQCFLD